MSEDTTSGRLSLADDQISFRLIEVITQYLDYQGERKENIMGERAEDLANSIEVPTAMADTMIEIASLVLIFFLGQLLQAR